MAEKVTYLGPADVFVADGKSYYRGKGGAGAVLNPETGLYEVDVPISAEEARHMSAWGAGHQFRIGDNIVRTMSGGDAVRAADPAATAEEMAAAGAFIGQGQVVEAPEVHTEPEPVPTPAGQSGSSKSKS